MFGLKEYVIDDIKKVLLKHDDIEQALIFGSRARGDYKNTSDIDLAIFSDDILSRKLNLLRDDLYMLDIIYKIDVVDFNRLNKEALKKNIISEGIVIYKK